MVTHDAVLSPSSHAVLLVEDDRAETRILRDRLAGSQPGRFQVEVVPRLENAVEALRQRAYDVLMIHLELPQEPGLGTLLRAQMLAHRIPIVIMTDYADEELGLKAVGAGIQDYLVTRGAIPADLGRTLRHAIVRHQIVSQLRRSRQASASQASFDATTGLPNRSSFVRKLSDALGFAQRFREKPALLVLELADFAAASERLGPVLGNCLLGELGRRLSWCVRRTDPLGRLEENEFAVVLPNAASSAAIRMVAERIRRALATPFETGGLRTRLEISIGAAWYPQDAETASGLFRAAETALKEARKTGGVRCQLFRGPETPPWPEGLINNVLPMPMPGGAK